MGCINVYWRKQVIVWYSSQWSRAAMKTIPILINPRPVKIQSVEVAMSYTATARVASINSPKTTVMAEYRNRIDFRDESG